jgi:mono/diheme cytochrome c family protein
VSWPARFVLAFLLLNGAGCSTGIFAPPPPISPALIVYGRAAKVDARQLDEGRNLFVGRCVECHTLPPVAKYSPGKWPRLVSKMAERARLTAADKAAVIAYLQAAAGTAATRQ